MCVEIKGVWTLSILPEGPHGKDQFVLYKYSNGVRMFRPGLRIRRGFPNRYTSATDPKGTVTKYVDPYRSAQNPSTPYTHIGKFDFKNDNIPYYLLRFHEL